MKKSILFLLTIAVTFAATAQELTYDSYMQRVLENNTAIVAEAMNIDIAQQALKSSKVYIKKNILNLKRLLLRMLDMYILNHLQQRL